MLKNLRTYIVIRRSGLFDKRYYLQNYPDVRRADVDPLTHFIEHGWKEGRNPSQKFDTKYYLETNLDVKKAGINPLIHYLKYGKYEKRNAQPDNDFKSLTCQAEEIHSQLLDREEKQIEINGFLQDSPPYKQNVKVKEKNLLSKNINLSRILDLALKSAMVLLRQGPKGLINKINQYNDRKKSQVDAGTELKSSAARPKVSIVIPVFNMLELTQQCVDSIYRETKYKSFELIIVDNASKDATPQWLIGEKGKHPLFKYFRMNQNLGFGPAVNFGIRKSQGDFIVILNNDTIVSPGWLENLMVAFNNNPSIGIVSPVTNYVGEGLQIDPDAAMLNPEVEVIQKYASEIQSRSELIFEPNRLVFFCVMLRRELIDFIGYLDVAFEKGNFEDDDYCFRTRLAGYQLAIVPNSFVYHLGSATFTKNKISHNKYMEQNRSLFYQKAGRIATSTRQHQLKSIHQDTKISVIVRTMMNKPILFEKALTSLSNQTYQNFEVVIVNDGGCEISPGLLEKFNESLSMTYLYNKENKGRSCAANIGLENSQGAWLTFLDDDDIVYPWHLEVLSRAVSNTDRKFVYSDYNRSLFLSSNNTTPDIIKGAIPWKYDRQALLLENHIPIHTWLFSRKCIMDDVGKFDEDLDRLEDYDFLLRVSEKFTFYHVPRITCEYRFYIHSPNSIYTDRDKTISALEKIYFRYPVDDQKLKIQREKLLLDLRQQVYQINELLKIKNIDESKRVTERKIIQLVTGL